MTKKFSTRKALFASVLSLVLCVTMLVGTTFAWFTDSVTSARNTIQAGNLDVVLEYWDGDSYEPVTETTKLFKDGALWEPGYTEVAYLKVSNAGSLALKYQMSVNVSKEVPGKTKTGADIKLSESLQFKVVESDTDLVGTYSKREDATNANVTANKLQSYNNAIKSLDVKNEDGSNDYFDYVALIVYMPESVGNEANHDGVNVPSIEMGVNLSATQQMAESDSFGTDYDKYATWEGLGTKEDPYKITDASQFAAIADKVNNKVTPEGAGVDYASANYVLESDIDLTGQDWTPIGSGENPFQGTFDGNGKTIKLDGLATDATSLVDNGSDYGYAYGLFGVIGWQTGDHAGEKVTIKNLNLYVAYETDDAYVLGGLVGADAAGHKGSGKNSSLACDIEISNVTVNGTIISENNSSGATVGGVAGKLYTKGNIVINGCTNNATVYVETSIAKDNKVGGILGFYSGANSAVITNNTNNGNITSKNTGASSKASGICITGATEQSVNISNNTNNGNVTGTGNAVVAIAFSGNDKPICMVPEHTTQNNSNSGELYTCDSQTSEKTPVLYTFLVYGGKSQTPADNTTDDSKYTGGVVVMEINEIV